MNNRVLFMILIIFRTCWLCYDRTIWWVRRWGCRVLDRWDLVWLWLTCLFSWDIDDHDANRLLNSWHHKLGVDSIGIVFYYWFRSWVFVIDFYSCWWVDLFSISFIWVIIIFIWVYLWVRWLNFSFFSSIVCIIIWFSCIFIVIWIVIYFIDIWCWVIVWGDWEGIFSRVFLFIIVILLVVRFRHVVY